ncbi:DUF1036 domain-containing protein [Brevibacillus sp. 179-C8.2 HS]|uniref:DUF1036 domain-containing protein n=2 Tax=unclassified Brevibacillus TaxID=2684853 RepID=UPI0039A13B5D
MKMGLYFRNNTNSTVFVAYAYENFSCSPVNYAKRGWYRIEPGQTRLVRSGHVGGRTYYYYAEGGGRRWAGNNFTQVPRTSFHWCWNRGCTTCRNLGFRRFFIGALNFNFTITLTTSTSQVNARTGDTLIVLPTRSTGRPRKVRTIPKGLPTSRKNRKTNGENRGKFPTRRLRKR